jgi:hypothetical protein
MLLKNSRYKQARRFEPDEQGQIRCKGTRPREIGPAVGVLGREREPILQRFRTSMPAKFPVANWPVRLCGAVVQIDEATGRALSIARISKIVEKPAS